MPRLEELPSGISLFIDANIFLEHFLGGHPACSGFLERMWTGELIGVTSVLVLGEVRHGLLRAEVSARHHLNKRQALTYLQDHPNSLAHLSESRRALEELRRWPLRIARLTPGIFWRACRISERFGLLTNDALHIASLRAQRLRHIASADRDFRRMFMPGLTVWWP